MPASRLVSLNIPETLLESASRRATRNGRMLENQLLHDIELVDIQERAEAELLETTRAARDALTNRGVQLTDEFLTEAKAWGRS